MTGAEPVGEPGAVGNLSDYSTKDLEAELLRRRKQRAESAPQPVTEYGYVCRRTDMPPWV